MTPRLLLLTGPAAGDVAAVLDDAANPYPATGTFGLSAEEVAQAQADERAAVGWWDEVRDYWEAPKRIELTARLRVLRAPRAHSPARGLSESFRPQSTCCDTEKVIRSLPGGEEWLVGLVLPDAPYQAVKWGFKNAVVATQDYGLGRVRQTFDIVADPNFSHGPARLAILATDPPPLLVERVRQWGGDCWHLRSYDDGWCYITFEDGGSIRQMSWLEAVRAALGVS